MMRKAIALAVALFASALLPARAAAACSQKSTGLQLCIPSFDDDGDVWAQDMINAFTRINSTGIANSSTTAAALGQLSVSTITGNVGGTGVHIESATAIDALLTAPQGIAGSSASFTLGITASSGTFLATGPSQYSIQTSSGISMGGGVIKMPDSTIFYSTTQFGSQGGGGGSLISTGTLAASATAFPLRNQLMFDSTFVNATDTPTANATFITFKNMGGITSAPTRTVLTSGTNATYAVPTGVSMLRVRMVGGGGGSGGPTNATVGGTGGTTSFGGVTAIGGLGGSGNSGAGGVAGMGGTGGTGSISGATINRFPGSGGMGAAYQASQGGAGGSSPFGGAGNSSSGTAVNAYANSGSGAGGGFQSATGSGSGGGSGEYVEMSVLPGATTGYQYTIGAGGTAGAANASSAVGGSGVIVIDEYYGTQGFAAPASSFTSIGSNVTTTAASQATCFAGSTVTFTTTGGPVEVRFSGTVTDGISQNWVLGALLDGAFIDNETASAGFTGARTNASGPAYSATFVHRIASAVAAGSHSLCLTGATDATTLSVQCAAAGNTSNSVACQFGGTEVKNSAGTGDVSSGGANTLSGALTINGPLSYGATNFFESSEQTLTANTYVTVAHGFGVTPKNFSAVIRCKTADMGYSVGDEIIATTSNGSGSNIYGVGANSTNITYSIDEAMVATNPSTHGQGTVTLANWKLVLRAWRN